MFKYVLSLLCVVSIGHIPSIAVAQNLAAGYSDCSCVTPPLPTAADANLNAGVITSSQGDVLVDGLSAETNNIINANSQVLVGDGRAAITVGQSCQLSITENTQVSISQPGGPGSNLCIQQENTGVAQAEGGAAGTGAIIATIAIIGGIVAIVAAGDDDDPIAARPAASAD